MPVGKAATAAGLWEAAAEALRRSMAILAVLILRSEEQAEDCLRFGLPLRSNRYSVDS